MTSAESGRYLFIVTFLGSIGLGCATTGAHEDPLRNTRKLVAEGHGSLYRNGAFSVPNTSISLIPPGPSTVELFKEFTGLRARQSFITSFRKAAESVYIVSEGTKFTYNLSQNISQASAGSADEIKKYARENSTLMVYRSTELGKTIVGKSWELSRNTLQSGDEAGARVIKGANSIADKIDEGGTQKGTALASGSIESAREISHAGVSRSGSALMYAGNAFVKGYAAVPSRMKARVGEMGEKVNEAGFGRIVISENDRRKEWSQKAVELMGDTTKNYASNVSDSFSKAGKELQTTGLSLGVLKSLRWVLQGILWDATIEPAAKMTAASVGYIGVNYLAFPSMIVMREGEAVTKLALEVAWNTTRMGYDIVAPTGVAALAGVYGVLDFTGSNLVAGTTAAAGNVLGYSAAGVSKTAGVLIKGGGYAAGKGVQYIGVPLASAGIAVGGGAIGTAVGGVGAVSGGALLVTGEAGSVATETFGNIIAGSALVGGTVISTAGGAAYGVYELSKAVVVPTGYELGGGIVLSYGTMSHLGAHSILAVSDCAYLVLSLEGPRWVLYAIKGKTGSGEDLPVGAVVELKKMQEAGEEIYYLPVSDGEMKEVVNSVYDNLPELKSGAPECVIHSEK